MPKNNRRKKAARQHAARSGERYTRALRAARSTPAAAEIPAGTAAGNDLDDAAWERDLASIRAVQQLVETRGWAVPSFARDDLDDAGRAATIDVRWDYLDAFTATSVAGERFEDHLDDLDDELAEDRPKMPECSFSVDADADADFVVVVQTAGNWRGCRHLIQPDAETIPLRGAQPTTPGSGQQPCCTSRARRRPDRAVTARHTPSSRTCPRVSSCCPAEAACARAPGRRAVRRPGSAAQAAYRPSARRSKAASRLAICRGVDNSAMRAGGTSRACPTSSRSPPRRAAAGVDGPSSPTSPTLRPRDRPP